MSAEKTTEKSLSIAIAGGGIGGLATALALAKHGIRSRVFERRPAFGDDGAGIQLGPNATKILAALGVADALQPHAAAPDALSVHDGNSGRVLTRLPLGNWIAERHGAPYWSVHRQDLHGALLEAAKTSPNVSLATSSEVQSFSEARSIVTAQLADGTTHEVSGLVAADGLWSKLRATVAPGAALTPTGKSAYRAIVPRAALPASLTANDVHIWLAPKIHAVHYPIRAGREIALVVCIDHTVSSGGWDAPATKTWHAPMIENFAFDLRALLMRAEGWKMWPLQKLSALETWSSSAVTLLGDAAHPVQPFLAQGGALALEDAVTLANLVACNTGSIPQAFRDYENQRKARTTKVAAAATRNGETYHLSGAMALARNAVLRTAPPNRLMAHYDWLYGWRG